MLAVVAIVVIVIILVFFLNLNKNISFPKSFPDCFLSNPIRLIIVPRYINFKIDGIVIFQHLWYQDTSYHLWHIMV